MRLVYLGFLFLFFSSTAESGGLPERYWFCDQAGYENGKKVLFVSDVTPDRKRNNYDKREKKFEELISKHRNEFQGLPARCRDYLSYEEADKNLKILLEKAEKKYNFYIEIINFRY